MKMENSKITQKCVNIHIFLWIYLILGLWIRGKGSQESGAFLLGNWTDNTGKVSKIVFYDSLDPNVYNNRIIEFHSEGQSALWKLCRSKKLEVVADCHTHPSVNTLQSHTDQCNPMIPKVGHVALIVPKFAKILPWRTYGVGIHIYLGEFKWYRAAKNTIKLYLF